MTREQIDQAIARHADTETLYDKPYSDEDIVRVTGPFTVESLSPHRALPTGPDMSATDNSAVAAGSQGNFLTMILENLRKAGVKGTDKRQRINFTRLDPFPGEYIQAEGETDAGVAVRVSVGPEFGTLGDADIKKAALEAIKGSRCDLLLVCAFAFEASQPFDLPKSGKIAVKVINHFGDEVLKVYSVTTKSGK